MQGLAGGVHQGPVVHHGHTAPLTQRFQFRTGEGSNASARALRIEIPRFVVERQLVFLGVIKHSHASGAAPDADLAAGAREEVVLMQRLWRHLVPPAAGAQGAVLPPAHRSGVRSALAACGCVPRDPPPRTWWAPGWGRTSQDHFAAPGTFCDPGMRFGAVPSAGPAAPGWFCRHPGGPGAGLWCSGAGFLLALAGWLLWGACWVWALAWVAAVAWV